MAYATLQEVLDRMGHAGATDTTLTSRIEAALDAATTAIDNDTGRTFGSTTATKTFGVDGYTCELWVPDLVSVTTLKLDDDDDGTYEVTVAASGYELDTYHQATSETWPFEIVRLLERYYPYGGRRRRRVEIAGTWGWSSTPKPINQACSLLASRISQRTSSALFGVQSFGDLGAAAIRSSDPDYRMLIGPYMRPQVA